MYHSEAAEFEFIAENFSLIFIHQNQRLIQDFQDKTTIQDGK